MASPPGTSGGCENSTWKKSVFKNRIPAVFFYYLTTLFVMETNNKNMEDRSLVIVICQVSRPLPALPKHLCKENMFIVLQDFCVFNCGMGLSSDVCDHR